MKKILSALVLGSLLVGMMVPMLAWAQEKGPLECCRMGRDLKYKGVTYKKGCGIGETLAKSDNCSSTDCEWTYTVDTKTYKSTSTPHWGTICLLNTMFNITDWIFTIIIVLAAVFIIIGAVMFVTAAGSPERVRSAQGYLIYAAVGIAVALLAKVIPAIIKGIIG